jgi:hypothetical protein
MIRPSDRKRAAGIDAKLRSSPQDLPGIADQHARQTLVAQLVESIRRIEYVRLIGQRATPEAFARPQSGVFDPLRGAVFHRDQRNLDEAWWLVFLAAHFGRHRRTRWRLAADFYGQLGEGAPLTWQRVAAQPAQVQAWLIANETVLTEGPNRNYFGNHRKYESMSPSAERGTGIAVESYVTWVGANRGHALSLSEVTEGCADKYAAFDALYRSMDDVVSFGRTGRFDYLTLIGNLGLAPIEPGLPYLQGATGPRKGARLLFGASRTAPISTRALTTAVVDLGKHTGLGMQVFEDALCNWQKNPTAFEPFRG